MTRTASTARRTAKLINGPSDAVTTRVMRALDDLEKGKEYAPSFATEMLRYTSGRCTQFWFAWCEILERAFEKFDWSSPLLVNGEFVNYDGPADYYNREVEPFLGPLEHLREVADRYRKGEITHEQGREKITKTQAIHDRRASHPNETQQQTADAVGCSRELVKKVDAAVGTKSSQSEQKVPAPEWVTNPNQQAAFRKLPAEERDRLEALPAEERRGAVRRAAIAAGIVKVPSVLDQLRKLWAKASDADRRTFMDEVGHGG
jgi:hypothetical protein